jgi:hypothetical protein
LELSDRLATPVAPGDAHRMQERQFERPVVREQGGGVLAVRDRGEEFEQQGLASFIVMAFRNRAFAVSRSPQCVVYFIGPTS